MERSIFLHRGKDFFFKKYLPSNLKIKILGNTFFLMYLSTMYISLDLQKSYFIKIINMIGFYMKSKLSKCLLQAVIALGHH